MDKQYGKQTEYLKSTVVQVYVLKSNQWKDTDFKIVKRLCLEFRNNPCTIIVPGTDDIVFGITYYKRTFMSKSYHSNYKLHLIFKYLGVDWFFFLIFSFCVYKHQIFPKVISLIINHYLINQRTLHWGYNKVLNKLSLFVIEQW